MKIKSITIQNYKIFRKAEVTDLPGMLKEFSIYKIGKAFMEDKRYD